MSDHEPDPLIDDLILRVRAPSAPELPPMPDEPPGMGEPPDNVVSLRARRPWMGGLLAAAGLLLAVGAWTQLADTDTLGTRGGASVAVGAVADLQLAVTRDGQTTQLRDQSRVSVGEAILFQVSAEPAATVSVWVEGPRGREEILTLHATPAPQPLTLGAATLAYVVEQGGVYRFSAQAGDGDAARLTVEAR